MTLEHIGEVVLELKRFVRALNEAKRALQDAEANGITSGTLVYNGKLFQKGKDSLGRACRYVPPEVKVLKDRSWVLGRALVTMRREGKS